MINRVSKNKLVERVSQRVLYIVLGITALVFMGFYLLGYDTPFVDDASFKVPLLTDGVLVWMYILIVFALVVMLYSLYNSIRSVKIEGKVVNGIPKRKITILVIVGMLVVLLLTFLFGTTTSMQINGEMFTDKFWLQAADMFVNTILVMLLVSVGAVIFGATRYRRSRRKV